MTTLKEEFDNLTRSAFFKNLPEPMRAAVLPLFERVFMRGAELTYERITLAAQSSPMKGHEVLVELDRELREYMARRPEPTKQV